MTSTLCFWSLDDFEPRLILCEKIPISPLGRPERKCPADEYPVESIKNVRLEAHDAIRFVVRWTPPKTGMDNLVGRKLHRKDVLMSREKYRPEHGDEIC
jgi:hypothetical protein